MRKSTTTLRTLFLLLTVSFTLTGFAQNPDFSGEWKLNEPKSKLGAEFSFAPTSIAIEQEANKMTSTRVNNFQGEEMVSTSVYSLDGKESKNEGFQGSENISIAAWEVNGTSLKVVTSIEMMDGSELKIIAIYTLDGNKLVINNSMEGGPMESDPEIWVYDKQ
jgi:hypothetical protein